MTDTNPLREAAAAAEGALLMKAENDYLKQRAVALNMQVRTLTAEVKRLAAEVDRLTPEDAEEAPETDEPDELDRIVEADTTDPEGEA